MDWDQFKPTLQTLYLDQDLSLAEVMREMAAKYNLVETKSQFELQFKKWQFRKNCTAEEWRIVASKIRKRKRVYKESEVILNGHTINPKKLRKEIYRYGSLPIVPKTLLIGKPLCIYVNIMFSPEEKGPSPPTPEGFNIRNPPSPEFNTAIITPTSTHIYTHRRTCERRMNVALKRKRYDMLQALIEMLQKPNVMSTRSFGRNALACAAAWNDITGVRMLLPLGIDVLHCNVKQPKSVLTMVVSEQLRCGETERAYSSEILEVVLETLI